MEDEHQRLYTIEDIYSAFDMGLSSAVYLLEKSLILSDKGRMYLLEGLKKRVAGYETTLSDGDLLN
jgi:hypothetical protein